MASKPVTAQSCAARLRIISWYPSAWLGGAKGWRLAIWGHVTGIISVVELSFMVQDPRGIMEWTIDRSLFSSFFRYRSISCSVWYLLKTSSCSTWPRLAWAPMLAAASTPGASDAAEKAGALPRPRARSSVSTSASSCPAATTASASGTATVTVSKKWRETGAWPI